MKKLLLLLLLVPMISFGQDNEKKKSPILGDLFQKLVPGTSYISNGDYKVVKVGKNGFTSTKRLGKEAREAMNVFAQQNNFTVKFASLEIIKAGLGIYPSATVYFKAYNKDGSIAVNDADKKLEKQNIVAELKQIKELLDTGILTQEEFDKKAASLKNILLGN